MSSKNKDSILTNFVSITECSREEALQYLENADWNEQAAVSLYFESQTDSLPTPSPPLYKPNLPENEIKERSTRIDKPKQTKLYDSDDDFLQGAIQDSLSIKPPEKPSGGDKKQLPREDPKRFPREDQKQLPREDPKRFPREDPRKPPEEAPTKPREFKSIVSQKINTFDDFSKNGSSDDDDDDQGQAFYAGGSEQSGQQILGPRKPPDNDKKVSKIFDAVRKQGATASHDTASSSNEKQEKPFSGAGYSLNDNNSKPTQTQNSSSTTKKPVPSNKVEQLPIRFYSNGFTVGDGELRKLEENKDFIDHIKRGEVPPELRNLNEDGRQIEIRIEDHRGEEYKRVGPVFKPFGGTGHTVGLPGSGQTSSRSTDASSTSSSVMIDPDRLEKLAGKRLKSSSSSSTAIRLRLPDISTPICIQIDLNRTLADLRKFLAETVPSLQGNAFEFMEPPSTKIKREDERRKIGDAKLINTTLAVLRLA